MSRLETERLVLRMFRVEDFEQHQALKHERTKFEEALRNELGES